MVIPFLIAANLSAEHIIQSLVLWGKRAGDRDWCLGWPVPRRGQLHVQLALLLLSRLTPSPRPLYPRRLFCY